MQTEHIKRLEIGVICPSYKYKDKAFHVIDKSYKKTEQLLSNRDKLPDTSNTLYYKDAIYTFMNINKTQMYRGSFYDQLLVMDYSDKLVTTMKSVIHNRILFRMLRESLIPRRYLVIGLPLDDVGISDETEYDLSLFDPKEFRKLLGLNE